MADVEGLCMVTFVKTINIKDVIYMIADAWENVLSTTLCKSWFKILGSNNTPENDTPESTTPSESQPDSSDQTESCESLMQQLDSTLTSEDIADWLAVDSSDPGYQFSTDEEIIQQVSQCKHPDKEEEDEDDTVPLNSVTSREAADMLEKCLGWYEQQKEATATLSLMILKGVRDLACKKRYANLAQRTLSSYL